MQENFKLKNGNEVIIRNVEKSDYLGIQEYVELLSTQTIYTNQYPGKPRKPQDEFERMIEKAWMLVVVDNDKIVGLISTHIFDRASPWVKMVCGFGIHLDAKYHGQGIAKRLLSLMDEWAVKNKIHRIEGEVRHTNTSALTLYLKCGFEIEGIKRENAFINNEWYNSYIIGKIYN